MKMKKTTQRAGKITETIIELTKNKKTAEFVDMNVVYNPDTDNYWIEGTKYVLKPEEYDFFVESGAIDSRTNVEILSAALTGKVEKLQQRETDIETDARYTNVITEDEIERSMRQMQSHQVHENPYEYDEEEISDDSIIASGLSHDYMEISSFFDDYVPEFNMDVPEPPRVVVVLGGWYERVSEKVDQFGFNMKERIIAKLEEDRPSLEHGKLQQLK